MTEALLQRTANLDPREVSDRLSKLLASKAANPQPWPEALQKEMLTLTDAINVIDRMLTGK